MLTLGARQRKTAWQRTSVAGTSNYRWWFASSDVMRREASVLRDAPTQRRSVMVFASFIVRCLNLAPRQFRTFLTARPTLAIALAAFIIAGAIETVEGYFIVHHHGLMDPDNYMRIVRIRDGLKGGWFTHVVSADNAGMGTVVYWSHLIDAAVIALRWPLHLVLEDQTALFIAAAVTGPIIAALLAAVLVWSLAPLVPWHWLWTAPLVGLLSLAIFGYGTFGYVHHHLPIILTTVLAIAYAGRATTGQWTAGAWCGTWSAVAIWLSPEALPYVLMAMCAIGLAWCPTRGIATNSLMACATSFAAITTAAVLIDPPFGGRLSPEIDCISIVYVVLAVLICGASWLLALLGHWVTSARLRFLCCILACVVVIGLWLQVFPSLTHGLAGLVPQSDAEAFFGVISEMQPMGIADIGELITGILAVASALALFWRTREILWAYAAACGIVVLALAVSHIRFVVYSEAIGALMFPLAMVSASSPRRTPAWQTILRMALLTAALLGPRLPALAMTIAGHSSEIKSNCRVSEILPALLQEKDAVVLTEIGDTPEILWLAPVRTVGSLYHRSIATFLRARDAWRTGPSSNVPPAVLATGATHILACELNGRPPIVSDLPPSTLQDRLIRHEVPSWLRLVGHAGGYRLYLINRPSADVSEDRR